MGTAEKDHLISEVIGYLRAREVVSVSRHLEMFKTGMYYLSGRAADIPVSDAIEIVESAVDYALDHQEEE